MSAFLAGISKIVHRLMSTFSAVPFTHENALKPIKYHSNSENEKKLYPMNDLLHEVLKHYGLTEVVGKDSDPTILAMLKEMGYDDSADDSDIAWCSAALNYFCKKLGYERSGSLAARSWLKMPVMVLQPEIGDVVVLWRGSPSSWQGHVGLFITRDTNIVYILGGNQANSLNIMPYPLDRVLGYRRLRKLTDIT